ncbi:uncharacterized protein LOC125832839 [Solanum verrucosum]|uniref:uncharacterized protein LOC125832839 n=1 Tax=Solanum verrucosum TaxID=315347 RepID=UPI0020D00EB1|nr:uncharacterized protein LOC125832839 [Solanum verrucosum]
MTEELDQNQKIMSLRRERNFLLRKVDMLEAIHNVALEAEEMKIGVLKQKLDQLESTVMFYKGVFDATEREVTDLNKKLQEQDNKQWKMKMGLLYTVKIALAKIQIKELQNKVFEMENKLKIQDNEISQKLINENIQVGESSGANID